MNHELLRDYVEITEEARQWLICEERVEPLLREMQETGFVDDLKMNMISFYKEDMGDYGVPIIENRELARDDYLPEFYALVDTIHNAFDYAVKVYTSYDSMFGEDNEDGSYLSKDGQNLFNVIVQSIDEAMDRFNKAYKRDE